MISQFEPSAEKTSLQPIFFKISEVIFLEFEEKLPFFASSEILKKVGYRSICLADGSYYLCARYVSLVEMGLHNMKRMFTGSII